MCNINFRVIMSRDVVIISIWGLLLMKYCCLCQGIQEIQIKENSQVNLTCKFKASSATTCIWMKDSSLILVESFPLIYNLYGEKEKGDCSMQILKANFTTAEGLWHCNLPRSSESLDGEVIEVARITILVYPKSLHIRYSKNSIPFNNTSIVAIKEGPQALHCFTRFSNPSTNLTWYLDDLQLEGENITTKESDGKTWNTTSILNVNLTKSHDRAKLKCQSQFQSTVNETFIIINLYYRTTYVRVLSSSLVTARKGDYIALQCEADGNPPPRYQWLHKYPNSSWIIISQAEIMRFEVTMDNQGYYLCLAGNEMGATYPAPEIQLQVVEFENLSDSTIILAGSISSVLLAIGLVGLFIFYFRRKKLKQLAEETKQVLSRQKDRGIDNQIVSQPKESFPNSSEIRIERKSKHHTDRDGYLVTRDLNKYVPPDPVTPEHVNTPVTAKDSPIYWEPHIYENVWKTEENINIDHENKEYSA